MKNKKILLIILILAIVAIVLGIFAYCTLQKNREFETIAVFIKEDYSNNIDEYTKQFSSISYIQNVENVSKTNFEKHLNNNKIYEELYPSSIKDEMINEFPEKTNIISLTIDKRKTDKFIKKFKNKDYIEKIEKNQKIYSKVLEENPNIKIQAFFFRGTSDSEIQKAKDIISKMDGIVEVSIYSKEDALNKLSETLGDNKELLEDYTGENNIFPDSLIIQISDFQEINNIEEQIKNIEIDNKSVIDECRHTNSTLNSIVKSLDF